MKSTTMISFGAISAVPVLGAPTLLQRDATTLCGNTDNITSAPGFQIFNNVWNPPKTPGGGACITGGNTASPTWSVNWEWPTTGADQNNVKAFPNVEYTLPDKKPVAGIKSFQTHVTWDYEPQPMQADVAYDFFTNSDPGPGCGVPTDFEVMIWLAEFGGASLTPKGKVTNASVQIAGAPYDVWYGQDQQKPFQKTITFVAKATTKTFTQDVTPFFAFASSNAASFAGFDGTKQNLVCAQFGSETWFTSPNSTFTVSDFGADLTYKS